MRATAAIALLVVGCSAPAPGTDAGTDAGVEISAIELCDRLSLARCELSARCYPAFASQALADCRTFEQTRCLARYEALKGAFEASRVAVNLTQLAACESRMKNSSCPPTFPPDYPAITARAFADCDLDTGLLAGHVPAGELCDVEVECVPGTVCVKPGGVCKGTCSTFPKEGESCAFGCAPGLFCNDQGTLDPNDDRCGAPKPLDAPCANSSECERDLVCEGTCRPRAQLNAACRYDPDRLSTCEPGLACDLTPYVSGQVGTCIRPRETGGRCSFHWSCAPGLVCADLVWDGFPTSAPGAQGFCRAPSDEGANCSWSSYALYVGDQCRAGTGCGEALPHQCRAAPTLGQSCAPSQQLCAGVEVYCKPTGSGDVGVCTGPAGIGDRCAFDLDATRRVTIPCRAGYCDETGTQACRAPVKTIGTVCGGDGECQSNRCAVQEDRTRRCAPAC